MLGYCGPPGFNGDRLDNLLHPDSDSACQIAPVGGAAEATGGLGSHVWAPGLSSISSQRATPGRILDGTGPGALTWRGYIVGSMHTIRWKASGVLKLGRLRASCRPV